jgi:ribonucleoside-diphosphate reductase alpha chain
MIARHWTTSGKDVYSQFNWTKSHVKIVANDRVTVIYEEKEVEHPENWTKRSVDIVSSKYFRRADIPVIGRETSVRQLIHRVAFCMKNHGIKKGYFNESEAEIFYDELVYGFLSQSVGFNSPVWFNFGLYDVYGIKGSDGRKRYHFDSDSNEYLTFDEELERPGGAACFLSAVEDSLFNADGNGMFDHLSNECRIFLTGAGDGFNASPIRGTGEPIEGGGVSSGLISYLKVRDSASGYIKSGGKTRRSATLICLNDDHPDLEDFILWKGNEEKKAHALIDAGWDSHFEGEAYQTISGQNSNNSIRFSNAFMKTLEENDNSEWYLISRKDYNKFKNVPHLKDLVVINKIDSGIVLGLEEDGVPLAILNKDGVYKKIMKKINISKIWDLVCKTAWACGCPGIQFDDHINDWNTVPKYGRINTSNPCSEVCLPDFTVCNLGSVNLIKFFEDAKKPKLASYEHANKLMTIALDLVVEISGYPTKQHAYGSAMLRSIGLNHGNIGAVLMCHGHAYDSEEGRALMARLSSYQTLHAWQISHELANRLKPYPAYDHEDHKKVLKMHLDASIKTNDDKLIESWRHVCNLDGFRNNTVTCLVPQGTIGMVLDQDTLGCEPEFSLIKYKSLVGGSSMKIVNGSVGKALEKLGYDKGVINKIIEYIEKWGFVDHSEDIREEHKSIFATATKRKATLRMDRIVLGKPLIDPILKEKGNVPSDDFESLLGLPKDVADEIRTVNSLIMNAKTREEAVSIIPEGIRDHYKDAVLVFDNYISVDGHIEALAAFQPHISMSISKTVNMNSDATVEDVSRAYKKAWKLGVKCIAIYRDASKLSQPLNSTKVENKAGATGAQGSKGHAGAQGPQVETVVLSGKDSEPKVAVPSKNIPKNTRDYLEKTSQTDVTSWPVKRMGSVNYTNDTDQFKFKISDPSGIVNVYVHIDRYPGTNYPMHVFIDMGKQGETVAGLLDSLARVISIACQHGVPVETMGDIIEGMNFGPKGMLGKTSVFGIRYVLSVPDLIGKLLKRLPEWWERGRPMDMLYPSPYDQPKPSLDAPAPAKDDIEIDSPLVAKSMGFTGKQCKKCGSFRTVGSDSCFVCQDCGEYNGPCGS